MRARQLLPAALALTASVVLSACGNGGGLRVEGAEPPESSPTPTVSTNRGFGTPPTPGRPAVAPPAAFTLPQVRDSLQVDKQLDPYFRKIVGRCSVVDRCLTQGPAVDVMKTGSSQLIVLIHTNEKFVIGAVLMADSPTGPRRVWSLKAEQLKIVPSQQGDLVAESQKFTLDDAPCCPSGRLVEVYRWAGGQMTKVSSKDPKGD
ncbi:hypothetical protein [Kribbella sp. CA-293567]|uniref:hypothetical protein n=1 Tax=Kribbella sp. CA-293567 TaxID=3002436 RepID=UPI0022DE1A7D|nr:hypothetical protein [Kribbella sp. CA-293567]WBQ03698.1 hypothetical protein OX958_27460 [Kribbella sp. CA-293567]